MIGSEEEQLVFDDWTAEGTAELIEPQGWLEAFRSIAGSAKGIRRIFARIRCLVEEKLVRIELVVAQVLPGAAMEVIGAGLCHQVINSAGAVAILCRHVELQLLEFLHSILNRRIDITAAQTLVRYAIDEEPIKVFA